MWLLLSISLDKTLLFNASFGTKVQCGFNSEVCGLTVASEHSDYKFSLEVLNCCFFNQF